MGQRLWSLESRKHQDVDLHGNVKCLVKSVGNRVNEECYWDSRDKLMH